MGMLTNRGLLAMAIGLASGLIGSNVKEMALNKAAGDAMLFGIRHHHRTIRTNRNSGVAASKRAQAKRRDVAKHPRSAHKQGGKRW